MNLVRDLGLINDDCGNLPFSYQMRDSDANVLFLHLRQKFVKYTWCSLKETVHTG